MSSATISEGLTVTSTQNVAATVALATNGGTSETITVTNTQGTAAGAIALTATAGGVTIASAAAKDTAISGGQVLLTGLDNAGSSIGLSTNTGTSETITVVNTQGTGAGAVTLTATAGGITATAATGKDLALNGGQVLLVGTDNAASSIGLSTNNGTSETITVVNTQGTAAGAIALTATAGGITATAATGKDLALTGGQVLLVGTDNAASSVGLSTNNGTSETITVTNTQGTGAAAIALTGTAGGITITGAKPVHLVAVGPVAGSGISAAATAYAWVPRTGGSSSGTKGAEWSLMLNISGLTCPGSAGQIIGQTGGAANSHLGQYTTANMGTVFGIRITCLKTPAGGNADIDFWSADESTGAQGAAISGLTNNTQLINHGAWTQGEVAVFTTMPTANQYIYMACGSATAAAYTAGAFLVETIGYF